MAGVNRYTHTQSTPATIWNIQHNLNKTVTSDVFINENGSLVKILPYSVEIVSANELKIVFSSTQTGKAIII